jgi:hypothetical protein
MDEMFTNARHFLKYFRREKSDTTVKSPSSVQGARAFIELALAQLHSLQQQYAEHSAFKDSRVEKLHWPKLREEQERNAAAGRKSRAVSADSKLPSATAATVFEMKALKLLGDSFASVETMAKAGEAPTKLTAGEARHTASCIAIIAVQQNRCYYYKQTIILLLQ